MSRENDATVKPFPEQDIEDDTDEAAEGAAQAGAPGPEAQRTMGQEIGRIAELTKQVADLKDQLLRTAAESENIRKRVEKERQDTAKYAVSGFARDLLPVADNLRRAIETAPQGEQSEALKAVLSGVEATERQLLAALDRAGIKKMQSQGQPFDPNFHRVMQEVENSGHVSGTVIHVMQAGYMIHDRLLREAMVVVAKGSAAESGQPRVDTSA